jgi:rod shape-determining protein MreC
LKVPLTWFAAISLVVAIVAAAAILLSDRRETFKAEAYGATRRASDSVLAPVGDVLAAPSRWIGDGVDTVRDYFGAASENRELKSELKEMRQWRDVAIALKDENSRYRTLLGLKTDPPIPMVAARIVTDSRGPFADTRLANAGSERGVKAGNPVMSENGLVGRVIGVTEGASRVLLLTDIASRTPVMIDRTNARAILTGDGGPNPRLDYLRGRDPIHEGDRVLTSGDGGVVPRGLPVGTAVKGLDGRWRVVLASDRAAIDFVRILLFEDFTQVVNVKALNEMPTPPPTPGADVEGAANVKPAPPVNAQATKPAAADAGGASTKGAIEASALAAGAAGAASPAAKPPTLKPTPPKSAAGAAEKARPNPASASKAPASKTAASKAAAKTPATSADGAKSAPASETTSKPAKPKPKPPLEAASKPAKPKLTPPAEAPPT